MECYYFVKKNYFLFLAAAHPIIPGGRCYVMKGKCCHRSSCPRGGASAAPPGLTQYSSVPELAVCGRPPNRVSTARTENMTWRGWSVTHGL